MLRSSPVRAARKIYAASNKAIARFRELHLAESTGNSNCIMHETLESRQLMSVNITTYRYDNTRAGANTNETALTLSNVNTTTFGKVASFPVDAQIYAQPLVMTGVTVPGYSTPQDLVIVATENDTVYAFNAEGNNPVAGYYWKTSLLQTGETAVPQTDYPSNDITPNIGVTGTPVIDPSTNTIYVVGAVKSGASYIQRIYALDLATGANKVSPTTITAVATNSSGGTLATFSAYYENERPGLTLANGQVYVAFASHGDLSPWKGWVIAYNAATLQETYSLCTTPNGNAGGIWMSGGALSVDSSGNLYFSTGNGTFDANTGGSDYGMAIVKVSPSLGVLDYFAPYNQATLSNADLDYGCSSVIVMPTQTGTAPDEVLSASKWGAVFLNNSDTGKLGEYNSTTNNVLGTAGITSNLATSNLHNAISYYNGRVYVGGDALPLEMFNVSNGVLGTSPSSQTTSAFGSSAVEDGQGTNPTISSNGNTNGIVWALDNKGFNNAPAVLSAYNANDLTQLLWSSSQAAGGRDTCGNAVKFQDAVEANGYVYVGGSGSVTVYGLIQVSTTTPTLVTPAAANPSTITGTTSSLSVQATDATGDLNPIYSWSTTAAPTNAVGPTFSVNGTNAANNPTVTFGTAGAYTLTCTITDPNSQLSITSSVNVTVQQVVSSFSLTPANFSIANSATQQLTASTNDQFGNPIAVQPTITWSVNPGGVGGTVTQLGLYTAPATATGIDTVVATTGTYSASSTINVALPAGTVQVNLSSVDNRVGIVSDYTTFTNGIDSTGSAISANLVGSSQTYNGSNFAIGTPTAANSVNNVLYGTGQTITLPQNKYTSLKMLALHLNGYITSDRFTVTYTDGTTSSLRQGFSDWYTPQNFSGETKAVTMPYRDTSGALDNRTFYIYGYTFGATTGLTTTKTVKSITLPNDSNFVMIAMDLVNTVVTTAAAATPSPVTGTTVNLSVAGSDPSSDSAVTYSWSATNLPSGATVPTFSTNGTTTSNNTTATFYQAGNYTFTAAIKDPTSGLYAISSVSVLVNQTLTSIAVVPSTATVADLHTRQFAATSLDQFGTALTTQPSITWSVSSNGAGGSVNTSGLYSAPSTGTGSDVLKATSGSISGSASVTVVSGSPTVTTTASATPSPVTGTSTLLNVSATDVSGDASPIYTWTATTVPTGAVAPAFSVNGTGAANSSTATFSKAGAYTFTVTIKDPTDGLTSTSSVNVTVNQTLTTISLTPAGPVSLGNGYTQQFAAAGSDQFGQSLASQPAFVWSLTNGSAGTISSSGLYQAPASGTGSATVVATFGSVSGQSSVQVKQPAWLATGSVAVYNSTTKVLTVTGATTIIADPGSDQPIIQANGASAVVTINPTGVLQIHIGGLSLSNGATAVVTSLGSARTAANHRVLVLGLPNAATAPLLTVDSSSQLDLTDNDLVDHSGSLAAMTALLTAGYGSPAGYWNGNGIASSSAAATSLSTLGSGQLASSGTYDGESVNTSDVEVRYTYFGDATINGAVEGSDYTRIDNGFLNKLTGFSNGDFNYDGTVDGSDYTLIDNAFNLQGAALSAQIAKPAVQVALAPATTNVIIEPTSFSGPVVSAVALPIVGTFESASYVTRVQPTAAINWNQLDVTSENARRYTLATSASSKQLVAELSKFSDVKIVGSDLGESV